MSNQDPLKNESPDDSARDTSSSSPDNSDIHSNEIIQKDLMAKRNEQLKEAAKKLIEQQKSYNQLAQDLRKFATRPINQTPEDSDRFEQELGARLKILDDAVALIEESKRFIMIKLQAKKEELDFYNVTDIVLGPPPKQSSELTDFRYVDWLLSSLDTPESQQQKSLETDMPTHAKDLLTNVSTPSGQQHHQPMDLTTDDTVAQPSSTRGTTKPIAHAAANLPVVTDDQNMKIKLMRSMNASIQKFNTKENPIKTEYFDNGERAKIVSKNKDIDIATTANSVSTDNPSLLNLKAMSFAIVANLKQRLEHDDKVENLIINLSECRPIDIAQQLESLIKTQLDKVRNELDNSNPRNVAIELALKQIPIKLPQALIDAKSMQQRAGERKLTDQQTYSPGRDIKHQR